MAWGIPTTVVKKAKAQLNPPKRPNITYPKDPYAPADKHAFDQRENFISTVRSNPDTKDVPIESIYTAWSGGQGLPQAPAFAPPPMQRSTNTGTGSSGGGRRGGGGRGGGGGGNNAAALAQSQLDFLLPYLGGRNYTAQPMTAVRQAISDREGRIGTSTAADMATSTGAYDYLDNWLNTNLNDPYANVQLQRARVADDQNPYLQSQGAQGLTSQATNPDDAYGGFQNMLALLGAGARQSKQSSQAGSQMARASSTTGINAMDNSMRDLIQQQLAGVAGQESQNQLALDAEKRQAIMQILPLLGAGAKAPADIMSQLGLG